MVQKIKNIFHELGIPEYDIRSALKDCDYDLMQTIDFLSEHWEFWIRYE